MKRRDLFTSFFLLALGIACLVETSKLEIGTLLSPQAGFFPLILAIILIVLSLTLLGQAIKVKTGGEIPSWVSPGGLRPLILTLASLFSFAIIFEHLGYLISTFFLISLLLGAIGKKKWWLVIFLAFLSTLISYLIFGILLRTQLPPGILGS